MTTNMNAVQDEQRPMTSRPGREQQATIIALLAAPARQACRFVGPSYSRTE